MPKTPSPKHEQSATFTVGFGGDTSLGSYYLERYKNRFPEAYERLQRSPESFLEGVHPLISTCDAFIVNLETVLTRDPSNPLPGKNYCGSDVPEITLRVLRSAGITGVSLANNHVMDFGPHPMLEMLTSLEEAGFDICGAGVNRMKALSPCTLSMSDGGTRIHIISALHAGGRYREYGFFATDRLPGVADARSRAFIQQLERLRATDPGSLIIVCPHWQGIDYLDVDVKRQHWCRNVIDAGADAVIGHGTHKSDLIEDYKGKRIYFSIGNFVFNSPGRYRRMQADPYGLVVRVTVTSTSRITPPRIAFDHAEIITDNRITEFHTTPKSTNELFTSTLQTNPQKDKGFEGNVLVFFGADYGIVDREPFSEKGFDYRRGQLNKNVFYVLIDENWGSGTRSRKRFHQDRSLSARVSDARSRGAAGVVVSERDYKGSPDLFRSLTTLVVADTRKFFVEVATYKRRRSATKVIAITGSVGKSSTQSALAQLTAQLCPHWKIFAPGKNQNLANQVRAHLTKLGDHDLALLEVSASSQLKSLTIGPDIAIFTSIAPAHLTYLRSERRIAEIKSEIFKGMKPEATAIINADMPELDTVLARVQEQGCRIVLYGYSEQASARLLSYDFSTGNTRIRIHGEEHHLSTPQMGEHHVLNVVAALLALDALGLDWKRATGFVGQLAALQGRGQTRELLIQPSRSVLLVDESYNANPGSLRAALKYFAEVAEHREKHFAPRRNRRILVLGDMLELGDEAARLHGESIPWILAAQPDLVFLVGDCMWTLQAELESGGVSTIPVPTAQDVLPLLLADLEDGDAIFVKGSHGMNLTEVVEQLEHEASFPFCIAALRADGSALLTRNADAGYPPASLAKVMTAMIVLDHVTDLDAQITIIDEDIVGGSGNNLVAGDKISLRDALRNLLMASSNTTAQALARSVGDQMVPQSEAPNCRQRFVNAMNRKAGKLGLEDTTFRNASGLDEPGMVTTAMDMAKLGVAALGYPEITQAWSRSDHVMHIQGLKPRKHPISSTNRLVRDEFPGVHGGKTGTLKGRASHLLVAARNSDGTTSVACLLGKGRGRYARMRRILAELAGTEKAVPS